MALKTLLASEDVGALFLGPSFLPADPMVPLLDQDEEEALSLSSSLEGSSPASPSSPTLSSSSLSPSQTLCSSPLSSSPSSPSSFLESTLGEDSLSFPWLGDAELLHAHMGADANRDDPFPGMDWMMDKIDLGDIDLDSLMDHCPSDDPPSSPEDLLATLDPQMDLDLDPFDSPTPSPLDALALPLPLPDLLPLEPSPVTLTASPGDGEAMAVKTEPLSPPPPLHLELGSLVDVSEVDTTASTLTVMATPTGSLPTPPTTNTTSFLVSLTTAGPYLMVLTAKAEPGLSPLQTSPADQPPTVDGASPTYMASPASSDCDSDSGIESASGTPPHSSSPPPSPSAPSSPAGSSRTKPYSRPEMAGAPQPGRVKPAGGGAPPRVVEKKLKKMEQNKTAATRYRQKKRVEQEVLSVECDELEAKNHQLEEKVEALSREIKYLRDLMEEVRNAKNRRSKASVSA